MSSLYLIAFIFHLSLSPLSLYHLSLITLSSLYLISISSLFHFFLIFLSSLTQLPDIFFLSSISIIPSLSHISLFFSLYNFSTLYLFYPSLSICFSLSQYLPSFLPISKNLFPCLPHSSYYSFFLSLSLTLPC